MTLEKSFLVTLEARFQALVAITASSEREAERLALEGGPDSGDLVGTPQRLNVRICAVREVGDGQGN